MTRQAAESVMCSYGLACFPNASPNTYDECKRLCDAFTFITGRKAEPKEVRTSWSGGTMYQPELET